jgi:hypothetical protein
VAPPFRGVLDPLQCNKSDEDAAAAGADSLSETLKPPEVARRAEAGVASAAVPFDP